MNPMPRDDLSALLITAFCALGTACGDSNGPPLPPASIEIAPADTTISQGRSFQARVAVYDSTGHALQQTATLTSSDSSVVTITPQGLLVAAGPVGEAFIFATIDTFPFVDVMTVHVIDSTIVTRVPVAGSPLAVAVKGDRAYVTRVGAGRVQVLSLTTGAIVDSILVGFLPCGIVLNSTGTKGYVANQGSQTVSIIDIASRMQTGTIPVTGDPLPVALSPSDSVLFVTTNADRLYKIRLATNTVVDSLPLPATSHYLLAHPNDTLLYVATRAAGTVLEVNWRTMTVARTFTLGGMTQGMVLAPDRSELYVVNETANQLHVVTLSSGTATNVALEAGAHSIGLSADGTKLYVGLLFAGKISVFNRAARTLARTVVTQGVVRWMAPDAARTRMVVVNEADWVDIVR
jgi:YVTN family beta-propeller protein